VRQWLLNEALVRAVWANNTNEVRNLLHQGANPNHKDRLYREPMISYSLNNGATLKVLLQAGANPNAPTESGELSLVRASAASYHDVVRMLLRYGADVNAVDRSGQTALTAASQVGDSPAVLRTLLDAGARVDAKDSRGKSCIELAQARLSESGKGIGDKWKAEVTHRQRLRRGEVLRLLVEADTREVAR
jgi:ankyrin repeat protein